MQSTGGKKEKKRGGDGAISKRGKKKGNFTAVRLTQDSQLEEFSTP